MTDRSIRASVLIAISLTVISSAAHSQKERDTPASLYRAGETIPRSVVKKPDGPSSAPLDTVDCKGPNVLGTSRVISINRDVGLPQLGLKTYPQTLSLDDHEVVLTFDDGPSRVTTKLVLDALARECVHATFFLIGRNAKASPDLVKREIAEGHSVGHHSNTHPSVTLRGLDDLSALDDIYAGIAAVEHAGYPDPAPPVRPHVPFFRFPGFADTEQLLSSLGANHITVFGTDLWAADWLPMTPEVELKRVMNLLGDRHRRGGIILFHDTRPSTAAMLPAFLRALKTHGYKIVHLTPSDSASAPPLDHAPEGWTSETDRIIDHVWPRINPGTKHALAPNRDNSGVAPMEPGAR